ncbi:hypothetical protein KIPB_008546, partial [Kipferlia bialata]
PVLQEYEVFFPLCCVMVGIMALSAGYLLVERIQAKIRGIRITDRKSFLFVPYLLIGIGGFLQMLQVGWLYPHSVYLMETFGTFWRICGATVDMFCLFCTVAYLMIGGLFLSTCVSVLNVKKWVVYMYTVTAAVVVVLEVWFSVRYYSICMSLDEGWNWDDYNALSALGLYFNMVQMGVTLTVSPMLLVLSYNLMKLEARSRLIGMDNKDAAFLSVTIPAVILLINNVGNVIVYGYLEGFIDRGDDDAADEARKKEFAFALSGVIMMIEALCWSSFLWYNKLAKMLHGRFRRSTRTRDDDVAV